MISELDAQFYGEIKKESVVCFFIDLVSCLMKTTEDINHRKGVISVSVCPN